MTNEPTLDHRPRRHARCTDSSLTHLHRQLFFLPDSRSIGHVRETFPWHILLCADACQSARSMRCKTTGRIWSTILSYLNRLVIGLTDFTCLKSYFSTVPRACINIFSCSVTDISPHEASFVVFFPCWRPGWGCTISAVSVYMCVRACVCELYLL